MGIVVNVGGNSTGHYIGAENWYIPGAPFVDGIKGFASVFVTASFACKLRNSCINFVNCILTSTRWRNRINRDHCRRDKGPNQDHASGCEERLLEDSPILVSA